MTLDETRQLREKLSRGTRRPKVTRADYPAIWRGRLRHRKRPKAAERSTGKPQGIVKHYRRKGQATAPITQKADLLYQSSTQSHANESSLPGDVTKAERTKNAKSQLRQSSAVKPQGVLKARNGKGKQTCSLMGATLTMNRNQRFLPLLTPPQS